MAWTTFRDGPIRGSVLYSDDGFGPLDRIVVEVSGYIASLDASEASRLFRVLGTALGYPHASIASLAVANAVASPVRGSTPQLPLDVTGRTDTKPPTTSPKRGMP